MKYDDWKLMTPFDENIYHCEFCGELQPNCICPRCPECEYPLRDENANCEYCDWYNDLFNL